MFLPGELAIDVKNDYICVEWGSDMNVFMGPNYVIKPLVAMLTLFRPYKWVSVSR